MKSQNFFSILMVFNLVAAYSGMASAAGDHMRGKEKFKACAQCHGPSGIANAPRQDPIPRLGGQHADYIVSALEDYAGGERRRHAAMKNIAAALTKQDKEDIAAYIAQFELKKPPIPLSDKPTELERKLENCRSCHGEQGNNFNPDTPRLIGQDDVYLLKALKNYKNGTRNNPSMVYVVRNLPDRELEEMAAYYASQKEGLTPLE